MYNGQYAEPSMRSTCAFGLYVSKNHVMWDFDVGYTAQMATQSGTLLGAYILLAPLYCQLHLKIARHETLGNGKYCLSLTNFGMTSSAHNCASSLSFGQWPCLPWIGTANLHSLVKVYSHSMLVLQSTGKWNCNHECTELVSSIAAFAHV